jgi:5-methyltetrahydropteroyltriglutamate--homocysteine methyltransferase
MTPPFRAEHIGSLIRPPALLKARADAAAGRIGAAELRAAEDAAIRAVVAMQEAVGLEVVTDGEFRRSTYSESFTASGLKGLAIALTEEQGFQSSATHGHRMARRIARVVERIAWAGPRNAGDFRFLKSVTRRTGKVTLPGPAYIHYRAGRQNISREVYPDLDDFWTDLVTAYHQEMRALRDAGCTYLQIDETSLVKLGDPRVRGLLKERGDDWRDLLRLYCEAINRVVGGAPAGMHVGLHICRSQDRAWQAVAGYEVIADAVFGGLDIGFYFLEYDTARAGNFEPLRAVPQDKKVVLGLVSSYGPTLETADALKRRIEEASRYIPLDQLALSPQCGFATSADQDNAIGEALQQAKLARVVEVARTVWGSA